MGHRLSKIATRTGDQGTTGLASGERVSKDSPRIRAAGALDELTSWIGLVAAQIDAGEVRECLSEVQQGLFEAGAELSLGTPRLEEEDLAMLDAALAKYNATLPPLKEFVLPGGSPAAAACHVARTVCRRAESHVVGLHSLEPPAQSLLVPYLNRLSDLLFVVARVLNRQSGTAEPQWNNARNPRP